jgi:spore coat protein H
MQFQLKNAQGKVDPLERPWPDTNAVGRPRPSLRRDAAAIPSSAEFYQPIGIWEAHLRLSAEEWKAMQPTPVRARPSFDAPDGKFSLSNTNASRNGLLGAIGLDLDWTTARLEFGGVEFTNVAVRFKGNGTFLGAIGGVKKPLKVDLGRNARGRSLAGVQVLNFGNLTGDFSCLSDTMAYEFFRAAGVPASRSTFGHVTLTVADLWDARPFGLYVMVENIDAAFARERFGTDQMGLFKPVTYALFDYLGEDWEAYHKIYDPKLPLTEAQKRRVIETAKLVTQSADEDFARRASEFFDFDEVARFVAVNSLLSSYDGFLNNGQNFFMYLDPSSDRFGFLPWDLDRAWGEFPFTGTLEDKEQASIDHPWVADHRLLERLFAVPAFKELYRQRLAEIFRAHFVPARLAARVDQLASVVRPGLVDESDLRQSKFEEAIMDQWRAEKSSGFADMSPQRLAHQLKRFFVRRHEHVTAQLEGREEGVVFRDRKMQPQK